MGRRPLIDCDLHHACAAKKDLFPYLSRLEARRLDDYGFGFIEDFLGLGAGELGYRPDFAPPDGKPAQGIGFAAPDRARAYLDREGVELAVLIGSSPLTQSANADRAFAAATCRAFNQFTAERWLEADGRLRHAISITHQEPQEAEAEIRRWEGNPKVVGVVMPCGSARPFGHRFFTPILEAAAAAGLALFIHWGGEGYGINPAPTPAGYLTYLAEIRLARAFAYQAHLSSLIFGGVLERMPQLKVVVSGTPVGRLPAYLEDLDREWRLLSSATPWVGQAPQAYIERQVRFAWNRLEGLESHPALALFGSHLPHWDGSGAGEAPGGAGPARQAWLQGNAAAFLARRVAV